MCPGRLHGVCVLVDSMVCVLVDSMVCVLQLTAAGASGTTTAFAARLAVTGASGSARACAVTPDLSMAAPTAVATSTNVWNASTTKTVRVS